MTNATGHLKVLFQHDSGGGFMASGAGGLPIGLASVEQNTKGLKFEGQLVMEDPFVQRVYSHMKAGTLDGMSIGYDVMPGGAKVLESGVRELSALRCWEISAVAWGMNPKAKIEQVKALPKFSTLRECEAWLRDVAGLSHGAAKDFVAQFKQVLLGTRDESARDEPRQDDLKAVLQFLETVAK